MDYRRLLNIGETTGYLIILVANKTKNVMEFLSTLWMPILLSAVFVFILSSLIHMVLGYHANDYKKLPDEERVLDSLRAHNIPPGDYAAPKPANMKDMNSPEFKAKVARGPVVLMTVRGGDAGMGKNLIQWFVYLLVVSVFAAYIASNTLLPDAEYLKVHRVVGAAAFMGYGLGLFQDSIWHARSWSFTWKNVFDALLYAFVTGGTFGWLWG